jgi:endonuclease/exonuclease/phosphatase (EEP) superfamily protein YafD
MTAKLSCMVSTAVAAVLFVASLRYVTDFWLLAFVTSFQLHIAIVCILLSCLVFWLTRDAVSALLVVWSLALAIHAIAMLLEFSTSATPAPGAKPFRLLSFNVLMDNAANADAIADTILESGADAVYLFEAAALKSALPRLQQTYPHRLGCYTGTPGCDLVILSKRPLLEARFHSLSDLRRDRFAIAHIDLDGTELTLAAGHITKPYFDDYHRDELDEASEILFRVTGPLILAGDFMADGGRPLRHRHRPHLRPRTGDADENHPIARQPRFQSLRPDGGFHDREIAEGLIAPLRPRRGNRPTAAPRVPNKDRPA